MKKLLMMIGAAASCVALSMSALADLPSGYRQLDYVDTDGSQWVNTLFRPTCTNAVEIKASFPNPARSTAEQFLYCSRKGTTGTDKRAHFFYVNKTGKAIFGFGNKSSNANGKAGTVTANDPHVFFAAPDPDDTGTEDTTTGYYLTGYIDGVQNGDKVLAADFTPAASAYFCLFGGYSGNLSDSATVNLRAICRFWHFKVWDTKDKGNLQCHIVPVYGEAEQQIGLYDLVAGRFLPVHGNPFSGSYTLASDEEWATVDAMSGTVDLNGNDLTASTVARNTSSSVAGAGYQDLAFITATGNAIQITDFRLPGTAVVKMKFRPAKLSATQWLFSSRTAVKDNAYGAVLVPSKIRFDFNDKQTTGNTTLQAGCDCEAVFDGTTATPTWFVNGKVEKAHDATSNGFTAGGDLFVCGSSLSGSLFSGRVYYFTVTTNDMVALDLRPVRCLSDGKVGLYDTVGGTFYPSGTSTAFPSLATPAFTNTSATASSLNVGREYVPGYTVVDHITASSWTASTAVADRTYIDTGYIPAATDKIEIRASLMYTNTVCGLFCSRVDGTDRAFAVLNNNGASAGFRFDFNNTQHTVLDQFGADVPFTIALDGNTQKCYKDGEVIYTFSCGNDFTPAASLYIFALHKNGASMSNNARGNIYWFKVTAADGTPRLDMVPVKDYNNVAGLYDRVNRRFYPSAASTAFTAGEQVGDGKLYADANCAFDATGIATNITLAKIGDGAFDGGGTTLAGTLKPVAGTVGGVTLQNGATLDLSAFSEAFSLDDNAVSFANGASITIALGSRTASSKTPLVSWTTPPANLGTLKFVRAAGASRGFVVKSDGIYLAPKGLIISFF